MPFPYDTPRFLISRIDPDGKTWINEDLIVDIPGERHVICSYNTKSYWPMSYHPGKNSLYIPYVDNCLDMTSANPAGGPVAPPPYEVSPTTCQGPPAPPPVAEAAPAAGRGGAPGGAGGAGAGAPAAARRRRAGAAWRWRCSSAVARRAGGAAAPGGRGGGAAGNPERRTAIRREGSDPQKFAGVAKVNMATGELTRLFEGLRSRQWRDPRHRR